MITKQYKPATEDQEFTYIVPFIKMVTCDEWSDERNATRHLSLVTCLVFIILFAVLWVM